MAADPYIYRVAQRVRRSSTMPLGADIPGVGRQCDADERVPTVTRTLGLRGHICRLACLIKPRHRSTSLLITHAQTPPCERFGSNALARVGHIPMRPTYWGPWTLTLKTAALY